MKKLTLLTILIALSFCAYAQQTGHIQRESGREAGLLLDLQRISLGTISGVEEKKQYLSTVQLEKQRIQNFTLRMVYEDAYRLYRRGDYQRAQELANVILSIDPSLTKAQTLAREAGRMATYGTVSEQQIVNMKYQEGISLYKAGRLVEALSKFEEILVLRPYETDAQNWVKRVENDIAEKHIRRGFYAYQNNDLNEALNQWYSVLLIKKNDKDLINKISELENRIRTEETSRIVSGAFALYYDGKLVPAFREFERALVVQPGEQQVQRFTMQLKTEIANNYYDAGHQAFNARKYNTAISNWKEAKNWGYDQNAINLLVKNAERAKLAPPPPPPPPPAPKQPEKPTPAGTTPPAGPQPEAEPKPEDITPPPPPVAPPVEVFPGETGSGEPGAINVPTGAFPTGPLTERPGLITEEARQASIERYKIGIAYFNQGNYDKAKEEWQAALQLNPENSDAALGLRRIEMQYAGR